MTAPGPTVGIEEEFLLADSSGRPLPRAQTLLACIAPLSAAEVKPELQPVQVEAATPPRATLAELSDDLAAARAALATAGAECGLCILPIGSPLHRRADDGARPRSGRHALVLERYAGVVRDYDACGLHVHVGVPDRDIAVAVSNHLRPWLPTLLALSANSPFHDGADSGYASWRAVEQSRFPGWGLPPWFGSAHEFDEQTGRLVACGVLVDERQTFWLARPSPRFPTIEVRAADVGLDVDHALLQAALTRGLVGAALRDLAAGREGPRFDAQIGSAAVWCAARHGVAGPAVDPVAGIPVPITARVAALLDRVADDLDESGDRSLVTALTARVVAGKTGAALQRRTGLPRITAQFALGSRSVVGDPAVGRR
ncbi:YbdK family carboxylate-amine ligase [Aldersonia sp. NBC_00410]|uniref:carboxylate-amine ligase n=1 Tax=Aldersonia sp. NBC_00410 TaxID=2975954 RepID=UPI00225BFB56|nr:YbdK family carboxylate-amine ligase [Aldersonia sp. NBC_00410]MCX5045663.1 YbdK family carboxylate-amine ligase [Aldersonia sp. NBC_00410]